jgi:hypothetical protein
MRESKGRNPKAQAEEALTSHTTEAGCWSPNPRGRAGALRRNAFERLAV